MRTLIAIGLLALVVLVFFSDVLFGPEILLDTNPYLYDPWQSYASRADLENETYWPDPLLTYLPRYVELSRAVRSGRMPLWNQYVFGGMPFLADPQTRVTYPISLALTAAAPERAMGYDVAIHTLIGMLGMFLFLRSIGVRTMGALIGGIAYGLSSFFYVRMGHPTLVASGAWVPFFFRGFELARRSERWGILALIAFFSMGYLAGFPQVFLLGVGSVLVYGLYVGVCEPGKKVKNVLKVARIFGISGTLSILIVSVQLVPFVELVRNSIGLTIAFDQMRDVYLAPPVLLLRSLVPHLFGNPVEGTDWSDLPREAVHDYNPEFAVYCGAGTLLLAIGSVLFIRKSPRIRVLLALLLLSVGVAVSPFLLKIAYTVLPFFRPSRVSRVAVVSCFALSAMAGIGFSMISGDRSRKLMRQLVWVVAGVLLAVLIVLIVFAFRGDSMIAGLSAKVRALPDDMWAKIHAFTRSGKIREWADGMPAAWIQYEKRQISWGLLLVVVASVLVLLHAWRRLSGTKQKTAIGSALILLIALDIGITARSYLVSQPPESISERPGVTLVRARLGMPGVWRTWSLAYEGEEVRALPPNTGQIYEIPSLGGAGTIVPEAYPDLFEKSKGMALPSRLLGLKAPFSRDAIGLADLAAVRYLIASKSKAPFVISPVLRTVSGADDASRPLRMMSLEGDSRLSLCQQVDKPARIDIETGAVTAIDFSVGFSAGQATPGDSVVVLLAYESVSGRVDFRKGFDLGRDQERWHPFRLDISGVSGGRNSIWIGAVMSGSARPADMMVAWSQFDLVHDDCATRQIHEGYEFVLPATAEFLKLALRSDAAELPLMVGFGKSHEQTLWISFPAAGVARPLTVDVREAGGRTITLRSDLDFVLDEAKTVFIGDVYPYWQLIHDRDMYVYENHAALKKGICIDKSKVGWLGSVEERTLRLADLGALTGIECGTCKLVSYRPERIELAVSAAEGCYLLLQDILYPGWKAYVDRRPTDFLRNDLAMRVVELDPGEHTVVMEFQPSSFRLGLIMTCLGIVLSAVYAVVTRLRSRQPH